jgi:hypothetical protein
MNWAAIAQSITDSDLQIQRHREHQTIHNNIYSAVVVEIDGKEKEELSLRLEKLGISLFKAKQLVAKYGHKRVNDVLEHTRNQNCANPAGYAIRALEQNWMFWSKIDEWDSCCGG